MYVIIGAAVALNGRLFPENTSQLPMYKSLVSTHKGIWPELLRCAGQSLTIDMSMFGPFRCAAAYC